MKNFIYSTDGPYVIDSNGVSHNGLSGYIATEILPCCGCGEPERILKLVHEILIKKNTDNRYIYPESDDAMLFVLYWLDDNGFTEHGTSIGGSWLSEKGRELLELLNSLNREYSVPCL